ncbi:ferritin family protein [Thermococcus gorgonarius]|nr:rubrerythrin [Thermococcus gorgonarius]
MATPRYGQGERETLGGSIEEIEGLDYKALLSYIINQEMKKAEMYNTLRLLSKDAVWDQRVTRLFKVMYEESVGNAERLLETFRKEFPGKNPADSGGHFLEVQLSEDRLRELAYSGNLEEILEHMIGAEKLTAEIYQYLMEKSENEKVKELLRSLSEVGLERARNLEEVLSSLQQEKGS